MSGMYILPATDLPARQARNETGHRTFYRSGGYLSGRMGCGMLRYIDERQWIYEEHQERLAREHALYRGWAGDRHHAPRDRCRGHHHSRYVIGSFEVFYDGGPIKNDSASTFKDLGVGHARDAWYVYFDGRTVSDTSANSFKVLRDGYHRCLEHVPAGPEDRSLTPALNRRVETQKNKTPE